MAVLMSRQLVTVDRLVRNGIVTSPAIAVAAQTSQIELRLRRPTTVAPLLWDATTILQINLSLDIDGVAYRIIGQASGGVRAASPGNAAGKVELDEYRLLYRLPIVISGGVVKNVAELGSVRTASFSLTLLTGMVAQTEVLLAITTEAPAPQWIVSSSVAFDAVTSAQELNGDGILSLTHTSTGSDRAVFGASGCRNIQTSTSMTYGGTSMTEMWDFSHGSSSIATHGYRLAAQATGAQTVTSTLSGAAEDNGLGVISMTGVDQTTPVGTAVTASGVSTTPSVTVGSVGTDDLVVDGCMTAYGDGVTQTVGADQTSRFAELLFWNGSHLTGSSQLGSAGGVMSWTTSSRAWLIGAVAFKPVTVQGQPMIRRLGSIQHGRPVALGAHGVKVH